MGVCCNMKLFLGQNREPFNPICQEKVVLVRGATGLSINSNQVHCHQRPRQQQEKLVFMRGATGTGKSRLSINANQVNRHHRLHRFDVFINHCGMDTKRNFAALLYDRLFHLKLQPFLDYKSLNPGDDLLETIEYAIGVCRVGVVIISPNYCHSAFCLEELALMLECEKKLIPIFYDIKTSDLQLVDDGTYSAKQLHRFRLALELAKGTVGISFDSCNGDWSNLLKRVSVIVVEILKKLEAEEKGYEQGQ